MRRHVDLAGLAALVLLAGTGAAAQTGDARKDAAKAYEEVLANPADPAAIERFKALLPRAGEYYVVEGDRLLTDAQVAVYVAQRSAAPAPPRAGELLVNVKNGKADRWCKAARDLTYAVDRASFSDESRYEAVKRNVAAAARQWEKACPACRVTFTHLKEHDAAPALDKVVFVVKGVDVQGAFIAAAFFPSDAPALRTLQVDASYFETGFDRVGVFRHELGHVLGYRHEHIRGVPGCFREDNEWKALGPYDPKSVMHYPCGGGGGPQFTLSASDKSGHAAWYGAPEGGEPCAEGSAVRVSQR
jgi:hypothetical protein